MTERRELVIIGAGPAGMRAAIAASECGADVLVVDERAAPGGQIYRDVETPALGDARRLGEDYARGAALLAEFRASGAEYRPDTLAWEVSPQRLLRLSGPGGSRAVQAARIIIATGAIERPFPVPGWTLPGVLSAGGAQILLKNAALVPAQPVVLAGTGPLLLLLATQLLSLGVPVAALLETTTGASWRRALPCLPAAVSAGDFLARGARMMWAIRRAGVRHWRGVQDLRAVGEQRLEQVEFRVADRVETIRASMLLLHQGVVPDVNLSQALGCEHVWDSGQLCFRPRTDAWGATSVDGIALVGDGAGIAGARSAGHAGRLAGLEAAHRLGHIDRARRDRAAAPARAALQRSLRVRPFLEALYRAPDADRVPAGDGVVVCRCEAVSAATVRAEVARGSTDPNAIKSRTRCGMGPCQGRYCGLTVSEMVAAERGVSPAEVGYFRLRAPNKPIPLADILAFDTGEAPAEVALPDPNAQPERSG